LRPAPRGAGGVDGEAVEQLAAGATTKPHTVHISGDVVCGTTSAG
jgi:hypothetical protein